MVTTELRFFNQQLPIIGIVKSKAPDKKTFVVHTRSGADFEVHVNAETWAQSIQNLDRIDRRRLPPDAPDSRKLDRVDFEADVVEGQMVAVQGVYSRHGDHDRYDALVVHSLISNVGYFYFEHSHWWVEQICRLADRWLDDLFGDKRTYAQDDFSALYRTNLNILGLPTSDRTQEMATLSRLIYGLSSAYLMSGDLRYFLAAQAGVAYQREAFRSISADGRFCLWLHARQRDSAGVFDVFPSLFSDDRGTIPLYEQIYALAGLAQYYRITNEWEVLHDISRTLNSFEAFFTDRKDDGEHDGYFSHVDPVSLSWNDHALATTDNRAKKNWNSIGDHLPAYLINLVLSLEPIPKISAGPGCAGHAHQMAGLLETSVEILKTTARLICKHFPRGGASEGDDSPYVCERFQRDWTPYYGWGWQKDRAVVGHNLKIAWNLTRVANYYLTKGQPGKAKECMDVAMELGKNMREKGTDPIRGGVYDAVERRPTDSKIPIQFAWLNTKDFWQQEQGILAYYIMSGRLHDEDPNGPLAKEFLDMARELSSFWNIYFLDRERSGIYFRVSDNGVPVIEGSYGNKGGHSVSGYHVFELAYLAHIYTRSFGPRKRREHSKFRLHFRPDPKSGLRSINVLPDFVGPDALEIESIIVDGVARKVEDPRNFQVPLEECDLGKSMIVNLQQTAEAHARLATSAPNDDRLAVFQAKGILPPFGR